MPTTLGAASFDFSGARSIAFAALFGVATLEAFAAFGSACGAFAAIGALVDYLEITQKGRLPLLSATREARAPSRFMQIDPATRRNLELTACNASGGRQGSLLSAIDATGDRRWRDACWSG